MLVAASSRSVAASAYLYDMINAVTQQGPQPNVNTDAASNLNLRM
jgi:hypothetical protein